MATQLQTQYGSYLNGLAATLLDSITSLRAAATFDDLRIVGRRLELSQVLLSTIIDEWQRSVVSFGATEEWKEEGCAFHFRSYKPNTCGVCRQITNVPLMDAA